MPGGRPARPAHERFLAQIAVGVSSYRGSRCIIWTGSGSGNGYGRFAHRTVNGKSQRTQAHRWAWEQMVGLIPPGATLDHLCRNRRCVNPPHLEPVSCGENVRRGVGPTAVNARKTHCIRGHEFTPENTVMRPTGRSCRTCRRAADRRRRGLTP